MPLLQPDDSQPPLSQQPGELGGQFVGENGKDEVALLLAGHGVFLEHGPGHRVEGVLEYQLPFPDDGHMVGHLVDLAQKDKTACLSALSHILPVLKEPWTPQECPLYRHMGTGDLTALAQSLYDRITEDLENSEEFAFFRGSPEYEQLCPFLKETPDVGK